MACPHARRSPPESSTAPRWKPRLKGRARQARRQAQPDQPRRGGHARCPNAEQWQPCHASSSQSPARFHGATDRSRGPSHRSIGRQRRRRGQVGQRRSSASSPRRPQPPAQEARRSRRTRRDLAGGRKVPGSLSHSRRSRGARTAPRTRAREPVSRRLPASPTCSIATRCPSAAAPLCGKLRYRRDLARHRASSKPPRACSRGCPSLSPPTLAVAAPPLRPHSGTDETGRATAAHRSPPSRALPTSAARHRRVSSAKDFSHSANDHFAGARQFEEDSGVAIPYHHCRGCGLGSPPPSTAGRPRDFKRPSLHDDYALCDPPFAEERLPQRRHHRRHLAP